MSGGYPLGDWADVTARYGGAGKDYEGRPWAGYGAPLYPDMGPGLQIQRSPILQQLTQAKKESAAIQATADITALPGGKTGQPVVTIIDGSTLFGNTAIVGALLIANNDVLINTYTVQFGYSALIDNEDPEQYVHIRPYDNTTANAYIDCTTKVDVAKAANGDGVTVYHGSTINWRPDQNFVSGARHRERWDKKWEAKGGDLIRTWLRLNATQAAQTVSILVSRIAHRVRTWELS